MERLFDSVNHVEDTQREIKCDCCGTIHNQGLTDEMVDENGDPYRYLVNFVSIGRLTIVECCFTTLERFVGYSMRDIVSWYKAQLRETRERLEANEAMFQDLPPGPITTKSGRQLDI